MLTSKICVFLIIFGVDSTPSDNVKKNDDPDIGLNTTELVRRYGYPIESHYIITEDGYILTVDRIPHWNRNQPDNIEKPAVLVMHGLACSSASLVSMGADNSLGFVLANAGFDVWMGNARGTNSSRDHITLNPDRDFDYWNFSWHEIGYYDNPAIIDYILNLKGHDSLYYIGHSQGCTALCITTSTRPEYNKKIKMATFLAPAVIFNNVQSNIYTRFIIPNINMLQELSSFFSLYEMPFIYELRDLLTTNCADPNNYDACTNILFSLAGYRDVPQLNKDKMAVIFSLHPAELSLKQIFHFGQLMDRKVFAQYDYGTEKNLLKYGSEMPPVYNLSKVTTPVAIYYGKNDGLVNASDIETLADLLPNVVVRQLVPYELFNHMDFLWATDVVPLLYNQLLTDIRNISKLY